LLCLYIAILLPILCGFDPYADQKCILYYRIVGFICITKEHSVILFVLQTLIDYFICNTKEYSVVLFVLQKSI